MKVWKNLLPKLEETLQLRKTEREERERIERIEAREAQIFTLTKEITGKECYLVNLDVCGLPLAKELIYENDTRSPITETDLELLRPEIRELNRNRLAVALEEGAEELSRARREYGLEDFPADIMHDEESRKNTSKALLLHPTSFCKPYDLFGFGNDFRYTYSDILDMIFAIHTGSLSKYRLMQSATASSIKSYKAAAKSHFLAANALFTSVALKARTMADANAMGTSFVCLRCHPTCRRLFSWEALVCLDG